MDLKFLKYFKMKDNNFLTEFSVKLTMQNICIVWINFLSLKQNLGFIRGKLRVFRIKNDLNDFFSNIIIKLDKNFRRKPFFTNEIEFFMWNKKYFVKTLQNKLKTKSNSFYLKNIKEIIILELELKYLSRRKEYLKI